MNGMGKSVAKTASTLLDVSYLPNLCLIPCIQAKLFLRLECLFPLQFTAFFAESEQIKGMLDLRKSVFN